MEENPVPRRRREWPGRIATLAAMLIGIIVVLYPVAATFYNNYHATQFAKKYEHSPDNQVNERTRDMLSKAQSFNAAMPPSTLVDPWRAADPANNDHYQYYLKQVSPKSQAMGRLRIPSINVELPFFHTTTDEALAQGAGHVYGTSLPVGGPSTHAALAAHRGLPQSTMFDRVPQMKVGDDMFIDILGETHAYRVVSVETVLPDDIKSLQKVEGKDLLTLITCTPYGINTHRLLVTGERIPLEQAPQKAWELGFDWTIQPWMRWPIAGAVVSLLLMAWLLARWIRADRRARRAGRSTALHPRIAAEAVG